MSKPLIAVDIDDVLTYSAISMVEFGNREFGLNRTLDDFSEDTAALWELSRDDIEHHMVRYLTSGHLEKLDVIPEARAALEQLKKQFRLVALTSRRDILQDLTKTYLDTYYPDIFDAVYHAGIYGKGHEQAHLLTKADRLKEIGAEYLIDDQPKHCIGATTVNVKAVLFGNYGWNRGEELPKGIVRCATWTDVLEYFNGRG